MTGILLLIPAAELSKLKLLDADGKIFSFTELLDRGSNLILGSH